MHRILRDSFFCWSQENRFWILFVFFAIIDPSQTPPALRPMKGYSSHAPAMTQDSTKEPAKETKETSTGKSRRRMSKWLRVTLKGILALILAIIILPFLLYIPPVQTLVKDVACRVVKNSTGMQIEIGTFRLGFPLDILLEEVKIMPAPGDTMVTARKLVADVKLLPLLRLDVDLNKLQLEQAKLRILSADSSMDMRIRAGLLRVAPGSGADIKKGHIDLRDAYLKDGNVSLLMDVYKKKPQPEDTTAVKFLITANRLEMQNFKFGMSMLPTIDTLALASSDLLLKGARIDLTTNRISADDLTLKKGSFEFITPTPEYIASHPIPLDTLPAPTAPPMVIKGKRVSLSDFSVLYAVAGANPIPGFDPSYISLSGLEAVVEDFVNSGTDITAPITRLQGRERCGLAVTSGSGVFSMDSTGMALRHLNIATPFSKISATALIPNSLMELKPYAQIDVKASARIGMPDIAAFMPSLKEYTRHLSGKILNASLTACGQLDNVSIPDLTISMPGVLSLKASGAAKDVLDINKLAGSLAFEGAVMSPSTLEALTGPLGMALPAFKVKGKATAAAQNYAADFVLTSTTGDVSGKGSVGLNSERYDADLSIRNLNVADFIKDLGVGMVSATLSAHGNGFDPEKPTAATSVQLTLEHIQYNGRDLRDITADIRLADGNFSIQMDSPNPEFDAILTASGNIKPGKYTFNVDADIRNANLELLGLSETPNGGSAIFRAAGTASPATWDYDVDLDLDNADWTLGEARYMFPSLRANIYADQMRTEASIKSKLTDISFSTPRGLKEFLVSVTVATNGLDRQIASRNIDIETLEDKLPPFNLKANASGKGLLADLLGPSGLALDSLTINLQKDSLINGNVTATELNTGSMLLNHLSLDVNQRGKLLDYTFRMRNGAGPMEEFATVDISGYLANNRASAYLTQRNIKGEQGYRAGITAALADSTVTLHFTPLKATIAYLPWRFNLDNYVSYCMTNNRLQADLEASSTESSLRLKTTPSATGYGDDLTLNIKNLKVQDFLRMSVTAPPLTATVNSDIKLHYDGQALHGDGTLDLSGLSYDRVAMQDLNLALTAGMQHNGSMIRASLRAGGQPAMTAKMLMSVDSLTGMTPKYLGLTFDGLPLSLANPFLGAETASLNGKLRGGCDVTIEKERGFLLNGNLLMDSVGVYLPIMGTTLRMPNDSIPVRDNVIALTNYNILACNSNPLTLNGQVDARKISDIKLDLSANANNFQLIGTKGNAKSDLSGKLFMNLNATAKGSMSVMDVNATATILNTTDVVYTLNPLAQSLTASSADGVVKFVNLSDTTNVAKADSLAAPVMAMRISAGLTLQQGMQATVNLNPGGSDKVEVAPSGTLSYFQNYMGDMSLNGTLYTGAGMVRYNVPVLGTKTFNFEPQSNIVWTGDIMNPRLSIRADDPVKANVSSGGQATLVDFLAILDISGNLAAPKVLFDLSAQNDMSLQNELQGMTPEQRSTTAMNLLLTGQYTGSGAQNVNGNLVTGNLYNYMASTLNSWAANHIKGVNLSFGVNQYQTGNVEDSQTQTSYTYQVSKSLFNNRFKIAVGGNYSTDASSDENFEQNLISDISFEYILRQTTNSSILARLFRHTGFESILEGEVTETGVGVAYRKRLSNLKSFFRFKGRKKSSGSSEGKSNESNDSPTPSAVAKPRQTDSIQSEK